MTKTKQPLAVVVLVMTALVIIALPASAGPRMRSLGTDSMLDGPPAADILGLSVGRDGGDLLVRVHLSGGFPVQGSYPGAGIEWIFDVRGRTFVAEGHPEPGEFRFTLFEIVDDTFNQIENLEGSFDPLTGHLDMYVPLNLIGAMRGTVISGTGSNGTEDVNVHQHAGPVSPLLDAMATTKDFRVP